MILFYYQLLNVKYKKKIIIIIKCNKINYKNKQILL